MLKVILAVVAAPAFVDWLFRLLLFLASMRRRPRGGSVVRSWLVVIPAREEGPFVVPTLESVQRAAERARADGIEVETLLLLDGADEEAQRAAETAGARIALKEPAGPTKAAALEWFGANEAARLDAHEAVLVLDVASRLNEEFFLSFRWPAGADAVQTFFRSAGRGVGEAAAASEGIAQRYEDAGRSALSWSVRLRGTGSVFRSRTFRVATEGVRTQVEDLEASLVLPSLGFRIDLAEGDAFVFDQKPDDVASAAAQRARWLAGRFQLAARRVADFGRLFRRKPFEATAFAAEIFGRPLALTIALRLLCGAGILALALADSAPWWMAGGGALIVSAFSDAALHLMRGSAGASSRMLLAWLRALVIAPRALVRWMRAKRS